MIFDLHNDILTEKISQQKMLKLLEHYENSQKIYSIILAAWTTESKYPMELIQNAIAVSKTSKKIHYSIEDLDFINFDNIDLLISEKSTKPIYVSLTWNNNNSLGGGALSLGGLTDKGRNIIKILEDSNIVIDTAHLNQETFWDVLKLSKNPIICSHCCFCSVLEHPRNLYDNQISAIIERDGIIGISLVPKFLSHSPTRIVDLFRHIDYFINRFGYKNLAIGTDFFGTSQLPIGIKGYDDLQKLAKVMSKYGYSDAVINAVFYKNAQDFFDLQLT